MESLKLKISRPGDVCDAMWGEIIKKVRNSVIFLDEYVAESLHWNAKFKPLIEAGAKDIKEFRLYESYDEKAEKAVFILGTAITTGIVTDTLRQIIKSSNFKYVVVVTAAHPSVQSFATSDSKGEGDPEVMANMEENILDWLGNKNYTVEIFYYPVIIAPVAEDLFCLPVFSDLFPLFDCDLAEITDLHLKYSKGESKNFTSPNEVEFQHLPKAFCLAIRQFIACFHSFLQGMNVREEIFSLGHISRIIAAELESYNPARVRRKTAPQKVSIVFVDRTLDLISASSHDDTLMTHIMSLLPRLDGHRIDSSVNMSILSNIYPSCQWTLLPGNFGCVDNDITRSILNSSFTSSTKETLSLINDKVTAALVISETKNYTKGKNLFTKLKKLCSERKSFEDNFGLIQQGVAALEVTQHPLNSQLEEIISLEKSLLQSFSDDSSPTEQVISLLHMLEKSNMSLDAILCLLIYVASLQGNLSFDDTLQPLLVNTLSQAILDEKFKLSDTLREIVGCDVDEVSALQTANRIWRKLQSISRSRNTLKDYKVLYGRKSQAEPNVYKSLLSRLVQDCLDPPPQSITDLEYKSAGLKDFIKTGFSLFVNVSKPKPRDAALMIIYVIGGITPSEVRAIRNIVRTTAPSFEVLIGSSHITYPSDTSAHCFRKHPLLNSTN